MKILQIIFLVLIVSHKVLTNRLVENTTCLELAKPSNQQLRLTCSQYDYHCLLDDTFTKEFEVCREWKWIPGGKCAYFNTYGNGNVDERDCKPGINLTCSESNHQFESYKNTQFTACYKKKPIVTSIFTTISTSIQATSNWTTNGDVETPSSTTEIWTVLPIVFGISVPLLTVSLICSICMRLKATKKDKTLEGQIGDEAAQHTAGPYLVKSENEEEKDEESTDQLNEVLSTELQPLLKNHLKDSLENPLTTRLKNEDNIPEEPKGDEEKPPENTTGSDTVKSDVEKKKMNNSTDKLNEVEKIFQKGVEDSEHLDNTGSLENCKNDVSSQPNTINEDFKLSPGELTECPTDKSSDNGTENGMSEVFNNTIESLKSTESTTDNTLKGQKGDEEKPANSSAVSDPIKSDTKEKNKDECYIAIENLPAGKSNDEENKKESTDVFDDTIETLQRIAPPKDENDRKEYVGIYNLLNEEGWKLSKEVMTATITMKTGKSVLTLINNLTDQEKRKLKEVLPEEFNRILESKEEREKSFLVLYGLHLNYLDKELCPKSGWGNPVRGKDIGIGDDVDRLYRILNIVRGISIPETVSIKSYIRLLDIMLPSLTRLNSNAEFMDSLKAFEKEITCLKTTLGNTDTNSF